MLLPSLPARMWSSPRPWRCFWEIIFPIKEIKVFSTSVEVFPTTSVACDMKKGLLHVRGGVSELLATMGTAATSSPRPWRCFRQTCAVFDTVAVFSTSVEVFLVPLMPYEFDACLLRVRGGVSQMLLLIGFSLWSSPRPWRCFSSKRWGRSRRLVFSTSVEVFPEHSFLL